MTMIMIMSPCEPGFSACTAAIRQHRTIATSLDAVLDPYIESSLTLQSIIPCCHLVMYSTPDLEFSLTLSAMYPEHVLTCMHRTQSNVSISPNAYHIASLWYIF